MLYKAKNFGGIYLGIYLGGYCSGCYFPGEGYQRNPCTRRSVKGLSQITPGPRTVSENGYFGHFRTMPGQVPFDFTGARTVITTHTGASVQRVCFQWILSAFSSNR